MRALSIAYNSSATPNISAIINKAPANGNLLNIKANPAPNLKPDLTKLIEKCQFVFDSLDCIF